MTYEFNTGMKVFSQLYVGRKAQFVGGEYNSKKGKWEGHVPGTPLGFATPYEDNAAGRKRQETVNKWSEQVYGYNHEKLELMQGEIIPNELSPGFKITDDIKRTYYGGGNVVFRVEDPRGFELEIQSQNLMTLISLVGLNAGGEIPGKCCWGRDGANNILIHESSEEYKTARLAAETIKPLAGLAKSAMKRGDEVILTNGNKATFLGRFYFCGYHDIADPNPKYPNEGETFNIPKIHFTSKALNILKVPRKELPASAMSGYKIAEPKQFYVVKIEGHDDVTIYRDIKAVVVEKSVGVEMPAAMALKIINNSKRISTASSAGGPMWMSAAEHKRPLVWKVEPLTEPEYKKIVKRLTHSFRNGGHSASLSDYVNRWEEIAAPISFMIEKEGNLFLATHNGFHNTSLAIAFGKQTVASTALVRIIDDAIYMNEMDAAQCAPHYYSWEARQLSPVEGEPVEMFVYNKGPKGHELLPLEMWYNEGILKSLKLVYESEK